MAASEAILSLVAKLTGFDAGSKEVRQLADTFVELKASGEGTQAALQKAASAIDQTGDAERRVAQVSSEVVAELERVGSTAVETGQEAAAATRQHANAHEEVVAAAGQERKANESAAAAVDKLSAEYVEFAASVRASGATLESQIEVLSTYETRLKSVAAGEKEFGDGSETSAKAAARALETVSAELGNVKSALRLLEADNALANLKDDVVTADAAFENAVAAILKVRAEIKETGAVGERSIGRAVSAVELYRSTVIEAAGSIDQARAEEVARLGQLEQHIARVNDVANKLTNARKDNIVNLQEWGGRIGGVGLAVQDLTRSLGPQAAAIGDVAAKVGFAAMNYEQLKDVIGELPGTIGLALVAFAAAAAAGKKLSETNAENTESWAELKDAVHDVLPTFSELKDRIGATQSELDKMLAGDSAFENYVTLLTLGLNKVVFAEGALEVALKKGGAARDAYYALIRAGFSTTDAERLALEKTGLAAAAYAKAKEQGASAINLWNIAVAQSGGNAERLAQILPATIKQIDAIAKSAELAAAAEKEWAAAQQTAGSATADNTAIVQKALETAEQYEQAIDGTTANINTLLDSIVLLVRGGEENAVAYERLGATLATVLENTGKLTTEQRANIEAAADLAKKGDQLTEAEKKRLEQLVKQIETGNRHVATLEATAKATNAATDATTRNAQNTIAAAQAIDGVTRARQTELEILDSIIARKEQERIAQERSAIAARYEGETIEWLQQARESLANEMKPQLTIWTGAEAAHRGIADEVRNEVDQTLANVSAKTSLNDINRHVKESEDALKDSMTNVTEAQQKSIAAAAQAADATGKIIPNADGAAAAMERLRTPFVFMPGDARDLAAALPEVDRYIQSIKEHGPGAGEALQAVAAGIRAANSAARESN